MHAIEKVAACESKFVHVSGVERKTRYTAHSSAERDFKIFSGIDRIQAADRAINENLEAIKKEALAGRQTMKMVQTNIAYIQSCIFAFPQL
jgi:hypothetical protein